MSTTSPDTAPVPPSTLEEWCKAYCPDFPRRVEGIVAEWYVKDDARHQKFAVYQILQAAKMSFASEPENHEPPQSH